MLKSSNKKILITMGDPAGIGPEVTAKVLSTLHYPKGIEPVIIGHQDVWQKAWAKQKSVKQSFSRSESAFIHVADNDSVVHTPGVSTPASGKDSLLYLEKAVNLIKSGFSRALVTGPVCKESIMRYIPDFKGHTTYLASVFNCKNVEMVFVGESIKLVLVTRHVPLKHVPALITTRKVFDVIMTTHQFLVNHFRIKSPKIAVLGVNPHAGEGGHIGAEEVKAVVPAMKKARMQGMNVHGPFPADTFFEPRNCKSYDLVVAMYHDQGLIALKSLYFNELVNLTIGLPFIRTSPVHGTAFGIAGKNIADQGSMLAAFNLAANL